MKIIWDLPYATHTRFLESLSPVPHLEAVLTGRYIGFVDSLLRSKNTSLSMIFNSCRSNLSSKTGQNIGYLMAKYKVESLNDLVRVKSSIKNSRVYTITDEERWKISLMKEITLAKKGLIDVEFEDDNLEAILEYICTD